MLKLFCLQGINTVILTYDINMPYSVLGGGFVQCITRQTKLREQMIVTKSYRVLWHKPCKTWLKAVYANYVLYVFP